MVILRILQYHSIDLGSDFFFKSCVTAVLLKKVDIRYRTATVKCIEARLVGELSTW